MSIRVDLTDVADAVAERGPGAYLVTVGDHGPRVVSVAVAVRADGTLEVGAGRHTSANVAQRPAVTLLWPNDDVDPHHSLLIDGTASRPSPEAEVLVIIPTSAMRHRRRTPTPPPATA